jgi:hypothetical protein
MIKESIENIVSSFDHLSLDELDEVRLLDRMDTKYIFSINKLPQILSDLKKDYRILDLDGTRQNRYETVYYDTDGLKMYTDHHNGRTNRFKVRLRKYADTGINYFEIKFRNNKGRTIKNRTRWKEDSTAIEEKAIQLLAKTPYTMESLRPALWVDFTRMTFANREMTTRLTIDTRIHFTAGENEIQYDPLVIAEIKQSRTLVSGFHTLMHRNGIPAMRISKYCLGIVTLYKGVKANNFKRKILTINKVIRHDS